MQAFLSHFFNELGRYTILLISAISLYLADIYTQNSLLITGVLVLMFIDFAAAIVTAIRLGEKIQTSLCVLYKTITKMLVFFVCIFIAYHVQNATKMDIMSFVGLFYAPIEILSINRNCKRGGYAKWLTEFLDKLIKSFFPNNKKNNENEK